MVWTALSAKPLMKGGTVLLSKLMFDAVLSHELLNSPETNARPLSDTRISGEPCVAKVTRSFSMAADDVVDGTVCTSIHLDYTSTVMRSVLPRTGPA